MCKACKAAYNRKRIRTPETKARQAELYRNKPHRFWATSTRARHRRRGFDVQVSNDELTLMAEFATHCPLCDVRLDWGLKGKSGPRPNSPSWDRMDNERTMTRVNTWIVCHRCNTTKGPRSFDDLLAWARKLLELWPEEEPCIDPYCPVCQKSEKGLLSFPEPGR